MTSRIQTNRFTATGARPPSTRPVGELAINFADNQISVTDPTPAARDMLPIRYHATTAQYAAGALVANTGRLYRAKAVVAPKAFAYGDWIGVTDTLNIMDFGAKIDGTTADAAAVTTALQNATANSTIWFPHGSGNINLTWGGITGGPQVPLLWKLDGPLSSGARINRAFSRNNIGDLFENFYQGSKFFSVMSAKPDQPPILNLEYAYNQPGGSYLAVHTPIRVTAQDNAGALTALWGVHVDLASYANVNDARNWPQNVGVSSSVLKYGTGWLAGMHITAADMQNLPSSAGGTLLGFELGYHGNGPDDGGIASSPGLRFGFHLAMSAQNTSGLLPAEFAMGYQLDGDNNSVTKSLFGVTGAQTYQVFDARTATAPSGYNNPVAALRMDPGQIVDFSGASTATRAGWTAPPGRYFQYQTSGGARLRYMVGTTEVFNVTDAGSITTLASFNLPTGAGFSSDVTYTTLTMDSGNYRMRYTRANGLLQYLRGPDSVELWSVNATGGSKVNGPLTVASSASIGGNGITYTGVPSNNHVHAFGWDGAHTYSFVDGINEGALATVAELADHLPLAGGTLTGSLTINSTLAVNGTIGSNSNIAALSDIFARGGHYYFGAADQAVLNTTAAGTSLRFSADGWALSWNASNGTLAFFNNASVPLFTVDAAGNGVFHGTVHGTNVTLMEDQINLLQARIAALEGFSP